jgi:hypothetical protein
LVWSQYPPTLQILQKNSKKSCLGCNGLTDLLADYLELQIESDLTGLLAEQ